MNRPAMDVMHDVIFSAVIDAIVALKGASKGLPNALLRDLNAVHPNTTFADLPKDLQAAIQASTRGAFTKLLKEGYSVSDPKAAPPPRAPARPAGSDRPRPSGPPRGRGPRPEGGRPSGPRPEGGRPSGPRPPRGRGPRG